MATDTSFGKLKYFNDFLKKENDATNELTEIGTSATIAINAQNNGALILTTHTDDNDTAQIRTTVAYNAVKGGIIMEARITCVTDTSDKGFFIGFTDDGTTEEAPISLATTTFTTTASNAVGWVYDTDATTDVWYGKGVKSDADSDTLTTDKTMAAVGTWTTLRVEVNAEGDATFFYNGEEMGTIEDAITADTDVCACVMVKTSAGEANSAYVDYLYVEGARE